MGIKILIFIFSFIAGATQASVLAIVDSWIDLTQPIFINHRYYNEYEIINGIDDDLNGFIDDRLGWNFYNNSPQVFAYPTNFNFSEDLYRFYALRAKRAEYGISDVEAEWIKQIYADPHFKKEVSIFRRYSHGTHVASIALLGKVSKYNSINKIKILPIKLYGAYLDWNSEPSADNDIVIDTTGWSDRRKMQAIKQQLVKEAKEPGDRNQRAFRYLGKVADVANCSYGFSESSMRKTVRKVFSTFFKYSPDPEQEQLLLDFYANEMEKVFNLAFAQAPNTLFVVSAGNKGKDNDKIYHFPSNVQATNVLVVAATYANKRLGKKSNYGVTSVDIAAPGIAVKGLLPNGEIIKMSGTSQAAPYVAHYAAIAADRLRKNGVKPSVKKLKKIIMQSCKKQSFLQGKVQCAGVFSVSLFEQQLFK